MISDPVYTFSFKCVKSFGRPLYVISKRNQQTLIPATALRKIGCTIVTRKNYGVTMVVHILHFKWIVILKGRQVNGYIKTIQLKL